MSARTAPAPHGALILTCLLPLAACGEDPYNPLQDEGRDIVGGNAGVQAQVSEDVSLADVELAYPEDGIWEEGEEVPLYVAVTNSGSEPVTLIDVSGPDFTGVEVADGDLPLEVAAEDNLYVGAEGAPTIVLQDLGESLRTSQSIPVTFTFEEAGDVTVEVMVASSGQEPDSDVDFEHPDEDPTDG